MSELRSAGFGRDLERSGWPTVSVVVPVRNEAEHLDRAVSSILAQEYPRPFDVCLAIAPSDDDTEAVAARLSADDGRVTVVANPAGVTPAALNAAIGATSGSIVVRVDGHAELSQGYIRRAVETMCRTGAVNVGGRQVPDPSTPFEAAVASATSSWLGTGGAAYRIGGAAGPVDTVYLGVFDRAAGDLVGWFDETLIRNQDYELNIRLRNAGGTVWFDPELSVSYRPRATLRALARQYYEYGYWKAEVLRRDPRSLKTRQVIPPIAVGAAVAGIAMMPFRRSAAVLPVGYALTLAAASVTRPRGRHVALALATIHGSWSTGLFSGLLVRRRAVR